jgi:hypothetical protein
VELVDLAGFDPEERLLEEVCYVYILRCKLKFLSISQEKSPYFELETVMVLLCMFALYSVKEYNLQS